MTGKRKKKKIVAIIPARGGSKVIPRKNIKLLMGKPLIAYTIEASLKSKFISRTIVSTEDDQIAAVAKKYGAEVVRRPVRLSLDSTPTEPVISDVLDHLSKKEGYFSDLVVLLQPTSPLRAANDIDSAFKVYFSKQADSLLSLCKCAVLFWGTKGKWFSPVNYNMNKRPRRQEMQQYRENGAIYIFKRELFEEKRNRLAGKIAAYVMPEEKSLDVDTPFDLKLVNAYMKVSEKRSEK